jgi:hypothetical protein
MDMDMSQNTFSRHENTVEDTNRKFADCKGHMPYHPLHVPVLVYVSPCLSVCLSTRPDYGCLCARV